MLFSDLLNPVFQRTFSNSYMGSERRIELALTPIYRDPISLRYYLVIMKRSKNTHKDSGKYMISKSYLDAYDTVLNGRRELISACYQSRFYKECCLDELGDLESQIFICGLAEEPNPDDTIGHYLVGFILINGVDPRKINNCFIVNQDNYKHITSNPHELSNLIFDVTDGYHIIYQHLYANLPDSTMSYTQFMSYLVQSGNTHHIAIHGKQFGENALMTPKMFTTIQSLAKKFKLKQYLDAYYMT